MNNEQIREKCQRMLTYLSQLIKSKRISQEVIAERTGYQSNNVNRVLSGRYMPRLDVLTTIANAAGYDVAFINQEVTQQPAPEIITPKFLLSMDFANSELYILHRQWPSCLIWIKQETPVRFIVQDLYDDIENPSDILAMPFVEEAKAFYRNYAENFLDKN